MRTNEKKGGESREEADDGNPFGEVISTYSRAQAIDDGVLVDVTEAATEAGFKFPTAMTRTVFDRCVRVPDNCRWQDENGRLWDVLWMLRFAIRQTVPGGNQQILFSVLVQNDASAPKPVKLKCVCGPGDNLEPVLTVMLPEED